MPEREPAWQRLVLLAEAGALLTGRVPVRRGLRDLARACAGAFDACALVDGGVENAAPLLLDPAGAHVAGLEREVRDLCALAREERRPIALSVACDPIACIPGPDLRRRLRRRGMHSALVVSGREASPPCVALLSASEDRFAPADVLALEELVRRIGDVRVVEARRARSVRRVLRHRARESMLVRALAEPLRVIAKSAGRRSTADGGERPVRETARRVSDILGDAAVAHGVRHGPLRRARISVAALVRSAVDGWERRGARTRRIECRIDPGSAVVGDDAALRRVLDALLERALRVSDGRARVRIEAFRAGARVRITVSDRGGIRSTREAAALLSGDAPLPAVPAAEVLALHASRRIAQWHGGRLWIEPGSRGCRVHLELPPG